MSETIPLLDVQGLSKSFSGLRALDQIDLQVPGGAVVGLIGPNGSGKTTFFNLITGVFPPTSGRVCFAGRVITNQPSHVICQLGMARTFQQLRLFREMTVLENVMAGLVHLGSGSPITWLRNARSRLEARARELLEFVRLEGKDLQQAGGLPYGDQRRLEVARALATKPKLLLLDEPVAGMNPAEVDDFLGLISRIRQSGVTILMIEHNVRVVMSCCDPIYVFDQGRKIAEGAGCDLQRNEVVIKAYLGEDIGDAAG